ncbi:MAG: PAS domain-containing protein [Leptospiraceae bacterium]|nr:PAS domain-containing protein [Leptospiraceae bacterium]MCP5513298.1 PAS domain-containing protein [Leptospiraceae bacterium]
MDIKWTNLAIFPLLSFFLSIFNAYSGLKSSRYREGKVFLAIALGSILWSFCYAMQLISLNRDDLIFWDNLRASGSDLLTASLYYFSLLIIRKNYGIRKTILKIYISAVMLNEFFIWFFPEHQFVRYNIQIVDQDPGYLVYDSGQFSLIYFYIQILIFFLSIGFVFQHALKSAGEVKTQLSFLIAGSIFLPISILIGHFSLIPYLEPGLDPAPIFLSLTNFIWYMGLNYFRILEIIPLARDRVLEYMNDASLILSGGNTIIDSNLAFQNLTGIKKQSFIDKELSTVLPSLYKLLKQKDFHIEYSEWFFENETGQKFLYEVSCQQVDSLFDDFQFVIIRDITFYKELQNSLLYQMNFLNSIVNSSGHLFLVIEKNGKVLLFNPACEQVFQKKASDIVDQNFFEEFPNYNIPGRNSEPFRSILANIQTYPYKLVCEWSLNSGERVIIEWEITVNYSDDRSISSYIFIGKELSIEIEAEKKILNLENALDQINAQKSLIEIQKNEIENTLEDLKKTQKQLVHSEKMASLGQLITGIAHEINNPIGAINASLFNLIEEMENFKISIHEIKKIRKEYTSDEERLLLDFLDFLKHSDPYDYHKTTRHRRKELIANLSRKGVELELEDLNSLVEMNTIDIPEKFLFLTENKENFRKILSYSYREFLIFSNIQNSQTAINRVSKMLYALKNYSHINSTHEAVYYDLRISIDTVLTIYKSQMKDIEIEKNYDLKKEVLCFPDDLNHVWTNLLYNSLQAMNFKGKLIINIFEEGNHATVEIIDNGPGIPAEIQEKIFLPFFTTKNVGEGSGIGLGIVKNIIEKHNGSIELFSKPGNTKFRILLDMKIS